LVTLGIAVVIENALLYAFRADTRTINAYAFQTGDFGYVSGCARVVGFGVVL
jgi:branched-chain amino acid transport system permease protein